MRPARTTSGRRGRREQILVYGVLVLAVFAAAFTQGVAGFGAGLVAMAVLPLVMPLQDAVAIVSVFCLVLNVSIFTQMRSHADARKVGPLVAGAMIGVPLGVLALKNADPRILELSLGTILIAYSALSLRAGSSRPVVRAPAWGVLAGTVGGALGAALNTGGPPAVVYVTLKDWSKDSTKATLQGFLCSISLVQVPMYIKTGVLRLEHLPMDALALPTLFAGLWVGTRVYDKVNPDLFRRIVLVGLAIIGTVYVGQNLAP